MTVEHPTFSVSKMFLHYFFLLFSAPLKNCILLPSEKRKALKTLTSHQKFLSKNVIFSIYIWLKARDQLRQSPKTMDVTCILSALLFFVGNLLRLIYLGKEFNRGFNWYKYKQLEPESIQSEWDFRISNKPHLMAAGFINSAAWFVLCFPLLQLVYALNQQRGPGSSRSVWLHVGIVVLVLGGCFTEWIANFMYIGSTLACELMIDEFNLTNWIDENENDSIGLRSLEVAYFAIRGMKFWIDAFEWIALFFIMNFVHVAVNRYRSIDPEPFGTLWNALGLFIGLVAMLDFVTEVLRTTNFRLFSQIAFCYSTTNRLILLPTWLIILGMRLPYALAKLEKVDTAIQEQDTVLPTGERT